jgi:serine/threonine-protein kinase
MRGLSEPATGEAEAAQRWPNVSGYEVLGELGRGGMGVVYLARQEGLNRPVALKMIRAGQFPGPGELSRFRAEAEAVARLHHPNIVQVYEVGEQDGCPYFSLEYVEGGSLARRLAGSPLPARAAARLVETLARAMAYAHERGIVHRDLKPANVLLPEEPAAQDRQPAVGEGSDTSPIVLGPSCWRLPKITDFGLAKRLDAPGQTQSGAVVGTPSYMSPEQAAGDSKRIGPAADVYALGAVLYELLTGRPPFRAATAIDTVLQVLSEEPVPPSRLQPRLPRDLETVCVKCIEKEPARRYTSAEALAEDLRRFLADEPIRARRVGVAERAWRWGRRNRQTATLLAALVVVCAGAFAGISGLWLRAEHQRGQAEESFRAARRVVDEYLTLVSENRLLDVPGLQPLRKELLDAALRYYQDFVTRRAGDETVQEELADAYYRVAMITAQIGSEGETLAAYRKSLEVRERLTRAHPGDAHHLTELAWCHIHIGNLQNEGGRLTDALESYQRAREVFAALVADQPQGSEARRGLAASYNSLGNVQSDLAREEEALASYQESRRLLEALAQENPASPQVRRDLALACHNLGVLQSRRGKPPEALACYRAACDFQEQLVRERPENVALRRDLTRTYANIGSCHSRLGQYAAALECFEKARPVQERLVRENPTVVPFTFALARTYQSMGSAYAATDRPTEALPWHRQAVEIQEKLTRDHPDNVEYRNGLAGSWDGLGLALRQLGRLDEARAAHRRAVAHMQAALERAPRVSERQRTLGTYYARLASLERARGRAGEAAAVIAEFLRSSPDDAVALYNAACELALCVPVVGRGKAQLSEAERTERRHCVEHALRTLRQAVARGYKNVDHMEQDPDFEAVRSEPEFRRLLAELRARGKPGGQQP